MDNKLIMDIVYQLEGKAQLLTHASKSKRLAKKSKRYLAIRKRGMASGLLMASEILRGYVVPRFPIEELIEQNNVQL